MEDEGLIIGETDFKIIDEKELQNIKDSENIKNDKQKTSGNLKDDLIDLGLLDYKNLSDEEKKIFDALEDEKRDNEFYDL
ncbi:MAG: hypothetical protein M0P94_02675 [Candidatus Absconditabacterales bacterium]|nr:hypothetical protein [Candidatus Absconditabacterales bacterium]